MGQAISTPKPAVTVVRPQSNYLANSLARHIVLSKAYPKKLPKIPSILNSLPAIMKHFGGAI